MLFIFHCLDKPGRAGLRDATRAAHLAYLKAFEDRMILAGPLLTEDGKGMIGSLLIGEFADRAEAEAFAAGDPYGTAGLFESITIRPFRRTLPRA